MSMFLSTSVLQNKHQHDCSNFHISDTIERECLSVLHKLHDQVNGLQLVQVVVQPLAKLFNPASLAALVASNTSQSPSSKQCDSGHSIPSNHKSHNSSSQSSTSTPSNQFQHHHTSQHPCDHDGMSTATIPQHNHSRSQSFASSYNTSASSDPHNTSANIQSSSMLSGTSTYMMSPDTAQALIARLDTDRDVNWLMEIIGYGLSMPFSLTGEQDSVKDCCTIYCEWLAAALLPYNEHNQDTKYQQLSKLVPVPIKNDPNRYARKMLSHLYNVFLPRQALNPSSNTKGSSQKEEADAVLTAVSRQAVLCHRVLRTIESIAHSQINMMETETWNHLLSLLLTVNDKLLSPPTEPDDIGTQLQDRILGVLFDLMLLACSRAIPDATMWKTFHEMCLNWRHRPALVEHWRRTTSLLTKRIVLLPSLLLKGGSSSESSSATTPPLYQCTSPIELSIASMSYEDVSQTWYKFLNLIGNPVDLADPSSISRTDEFYHAACVANSVLDPRQHPCLNVLPQIFVNSMIGLREYIELFIGTYQSPLSRRSSQTDQIEISQFRLNPERPKCNSILHIFGDWLFSSALIGSDLNQEIDSTDSQTDPDSCNVSESMTSVASSATATEIEPSQGYSPAFRRKQSHQSTASSQTSTSGGRRRQSKQLDSSGFSSDKILLEPPLTPESFEAGQAEAMALLCRIFATKSSNEDISPVYLARFYLSIKHCLNFGCGNDSRSGATSGSMKRSLLASVLTNSTALLQKDLDGINLLIPSFIKAIEHILESGEKELPIQPPPRQHGNKSAASKNASTPTSAPQVNIGNDLRRSCILNLVNLLAYPHHFQELAIRNCLDATSPTTTFNSLRPRLLKLLFISMQTETDANNMQILFGGLSLAIHNLASKTICSTKSDFSNQKSETASIRGGSGHSSLDPSQERHAKPDTISQSSFVFHSNEGFLIKSLHVTCHLLINIWKHDNLVSLAALEVLTTIARISTAIESSGNKTSSNLNNNNVVEMKSEYMQATRWVCDYICNQCSRPPPAHSRDMHSTIVAAYQCLAVWFYNHPYLLNDRACVDTVMEVIELGVSGQKSKSISVNPAIGVATPTTITKGEKLMKPSSLRVREAAESLLNICMMRLCHNGPRNMSFCDSIFSELDIAEIFGGPNCKSKLAQIHDNALRRFEAHKLFKYYSDEESIIFGLMDRMNHDAMSKDSAICLLRTPFGRHCWRLKFSYYSEKSRDKIIANKTLGLIKRPFQQVTTPSIGQDNARMFAFSKGHNKSIYFNNNAKFFPETIENLPPTDLDRLVATLDDYVQGRDSSCRLVTSDPKLKNDLDKINKLLTHQVLAEQKVLTESTIRVKRSDCEEPQQTNELETARLIATHLGLRNAITSLTCSGERLMRTFVERLQSLDSQSIRTCDTVNIFYIRRNRTLPIEILESVRERRNVNLDFFEWLFELGEPVVVKPHQKWTDDLPRGSDNYQPKSTVSDVVYTKDDIRTSSLSKNEMLCTDHGGSIFDGERMALHWSDMCQEISFLVPHRLEKIRANRIMICWVECSDDIQNVPYETLLSLSDSAHDTEETPAISGQSASSQRQHESKHPKIQDYAIYIVCPMKNGLYRINLNISLGRQWFALPLVDGITASKATLGSLILDSVSSLCRRKRLDADSYQPHVKRRLKIQEICSNHI